MLRTHSYVAPFIFLTSSPLLSVDFYFFIVNSPVYPVHTQDYLHGSTVPPPSAALLAWLFCSGFFVILLLRLAAFLLLFCHQPPILMPVKQGLLLLDLDENFGKFLHRTFLPLQFFCQYSFTAISVDRPYKSHALHSTCFTLFCVITWSCLFPFHIVDAWSPHAGPPTEGAHIIL